MPNKTTREKQQKPPDVRRKGSKGECIRQRCESPFSRRRYARLGDSVTPPCTRELTESFTTAHNEARHPLSLATAPAPGHGRQKVGEVPGQVSEVQLALSVRGIVRPRDGRRHTTNHANGSASGSSSSHPRAGKSSNSGRGGSNGRDSGSSSHPRAGKGSNSGRGGSNGSARGHTHALEDHAGGTRRHA
jgi:hypothetical protein